MSFRSKLKKNKKLVTVVALVLLFGLGSYTYTSYMAMKAKNAIPQDPVYTLEEVAMHSQKADCWTSIDGNVYDVTTYIDQHPPGEKTILKSCGIEATSLFYNEMGYIHSEAAQLLLKTYKIGLLKTETANE